MYQYRNVKTGAIVTTTCKVKGKNWQAVKSGSRGKNNTPDKEDSEEKGE